MCENQYQYTLLIASPADGIQSINSLTILLALQLRRRRQPHTTFVDFPLHLPMIDTNAKPRVMAMSRDDRAERPKSDRMRLACSYGESKLRIPGPWKEFA